MKGNDVTRQKGFSVALLMVIVSLVAVLGPTPARAADPSGGTISADKPEVTWQGGPFLVPNPNLVEAYGVVAAICPDVDPTCDRFALTVDAEPGSSVAVAITSDVVGDDYDVQVFYPDGTRAAHGYLTGDDTVVFAHRTDHGTGSYDVRVQPYLVSPGSTYSGVAKLTSTQPIDTEVDCDEDTPDSMSTGAGRTVSLDVAVLLDGSSLARGEAVMAKAAEAYARLNVTLNATFQLVDFEGESASGGLEQVDEGVTSQEILDQAKDLFGGERPEGSDVVYVLTAKDMVASGGLQIRGEAECIGGVRFPWRAFAVGEDIEARWPSDAHNIGPFILGTDVTAIIAAHEIGHLMGGHHHYSNCVEGITPEALAARRLSLCTVMNVEPEIGALRFSTLNAAVIRGHAINYAAP